MLPDGPKTIGVGLLGRGSTNHLHRLEVVAAFRARGISVVFIVREDYFDLVRKLDGCLYRKVKVHKASGWRKKAKYFTALVRKMYPSWDEGRNVDSLSAEGMSFAGKAVYCLLKFMARFRFFANAAVKCEDLLFRESDVSGIDDLEVDLFLVLGIGTVNSELEGDVTRWARQRDIPVVSYVGNYDNLTSKGYRGIDVTRLLVWGPSMLSDATQLQGILPDRITVIGSLRYDCFSSNETCREDFLSGVGLDPSKKTIMFGGFVFEFAYFEVLQAFREIQQVRNDLQFILRVYPNKTLMGSPFVKTLIEYARLLPGVYVSIADPDFDKGSSDREVLQIEEFELMNCLKHSDVVINQFSTLSIEACLFDRPVINMWYFEERNRALRIQPEVFDFPRLFHTRRILGYDAVPVAGSRAELSELLMEALNAPDARREQRSLLRANEIGITDGKAAGRLIDACVQEYRHKEGQRR